MYSRWNCLFYGYVKMTRDQFFRLSSPEQLYPESCIQLFAQHHRVERWDSMDDESYHTSSSLNTFHYLSLEHLILKKKKYFRQTQENRMGSKILLECTLVRNLLWKVKLGKSDKVLYVQGEVLSFSQQWNPKQKCSLNCIVLYELLSSSKPV